MRPGNNRIIPPLQLRSGFTPQDSINVVVSLSGAMLWQAVAAASAAMQLPLASAAEFQSKGGSAFSGRATLSAKSSAISFGASSPPSFTAALMASMKGAVLAAAGTSGRLSLAARSAIASAGRGAAVPTLFLAARAGLTSTARLAGSFSAKLSAKTSGRVVGKSGFSAAVLLQATSRAMVKAKGAVLNALFLIGTAKLSSAARASVSAALKLSATSAVRTAAAAQFSGIASLAGTTRAAVKARLAPPVFFAQLFGTISTSVHAKAVVVGSLSLSGSAIIGSTLRGIINLAGLIFTRSLRQANARRETRTVTPTESRQVNATVEMRTASPPTETRQVNAPAEKRSVDVPPRT